MTPHETITVELPKREFSPVSQTVTISLPPWEFRHLATVPDDCLRRELIDRAWSVLFTMRNQGNTLDTIAVPEAIAHFQLYVIQCDKRGLQSHVEYVTGEMQTAVARLQCELNKKHGVTS
jgi:hypothetical protein